MQSTQALEARIEGLERQVRFGRRWILGLGGILACLGLQALAGPRQSTEVPEVITARMFRVVDENGRMRATLGPDSTGPDSSLLSLCDPLRGDGAEPALQIRARNGGAEMWMRGNKENGAVLISNIYQPRGARIVLFASCNDMSHDPSDGERSAVLYLSANPDGGSISATALNPGEADGEHVDLLETFFIRSREDSVDKRHR